MLREAPTIASIRTAIGCGRRTRTSISLRAAGDGDGPDAVGSHPATRSPFGVDDLAGNVLELVGSSLGAEDELLVRGGAYFFGAASCRSTNREIVPATLRDATIGFRVCATPGEVH